MTKDLDDVAASLRKLAKELWPHRQYNDFDDEILLLGMHFQQQLAKKIDKLPARWPDGVSPQRNVGSMDILDGLE